MSQGNGAATKSSDNVDSNHEGSSHPNFAPNYGGLNALVDLLFTISYPYLNVLKGPLAAQDTHSPGLLPFPPLDQSHSLSPQ